jgi:hypothetical protein
VIVRLDPVLTLEERAELEDLEAEEILQKGIVQVIAVQVMARIAKGPSFQVIGDTVKLSDREYVVRPDGGMGRSRPKESRRKKCRR